MTRLTFDPPSDPYGDERRCRICDHPLTLVGWECVQDHDALEQENAPMRDVIPHQTVETIVSPLVGVISE